MSDKVSLPRKGAEFINASEIDLSFKREWVLDPPPWIISSLDERIRLQLYKIKLDSLAQIAEIEERMYRQTSELIK